MAVKVTENQYKNIDEDIRSGKLKRVYLLYGEEHYLLRQYRDKLKKAFVDPEDTMNFTAFEGADVNPAEIIDLAETLPFFSENRLILIENSGWGKKTPDEIADYLPTMPETTAIIFTEKEIDKRSRLMKAVSKTGYAAEFGKQTEYLIQRWVGSRIRREGKQMTQAAYQLLILKTGIDMESIDKELEKVICYCLDKDVIDVKDVEEIVTDHAERKVFDMIDSLAAHKAKKAMDQYYELIGQRNAPLLILNLMMRQFHNMMLVKSMYNQGMNNRDIGQNMGCQDWLVRRYLDQCRGYEIDRLKQAVADGIAYEEAIKTGKLNEFIAVEMFISKYSKAK